jgi:hypothetical protein
MMTAATWGGYSIEERGREMRILWFGLFIGALLVFTLSAISKKSSKLRLAEK